MAINYKLKLETMKECLNYILTDSVLIIKKLPEDDNRRYFSHIIDNDVYCFASGRTSQTKLKYEIYNVKDVKSFYSFITPGGEEE